MSVRKTIAFLGGWLLCMVCAMPVRAADIEGVRVEDRIALPGGTALVLNGAGVRTKLAFAKLYVGALYLPAKQAAAEAILKDGGAKITSEEPIPPQRLFSTIDAMPMRRAGQR